MHRSRTLRSKTTPGTAILGILFTIALTMTGVLARPAAAQHAGGHGEQKPGEAMVLEEMVIKGERVQEYVVNHPQQTMTMDAAEMEERNFGEVGDALKAMPGVDVQSSGGRPGARISIRGSGGDGVLVLVNGRPLNSSQYGGVELGSLPIENVKRITVFKPPVPVWLGPGAKAGAINIETKGGGKDRAQKQTSSRIKLRGGSYGTANVSLSHERGLDKGSLMLTAGGSHEDGKRPNSDRDSGRLSLHWDRPLQRENHVEANARYYLSEHGSPGPIDNPTPEARQRYEKGALDLKLSGSPGRDREYSLKTYADLVRLEDKAQSEVDSELDVAKLGLQGDTVWSERNGQWAVRMGGLFEENMIDHSLTGYYKREKTSAHIQADRHFQPLTLSLGLRGDYTSDFGLFPAATGGMSYSLGNSTLLKANAGYSVDVPTFGQLYQPSHGSYDQVRGNPDLSEEHIASYDLGLEHSFTRDFSLETTLFRTDTYDKIVHQRGDDLIYRPVNVDRAVRQGMELTCSLELEKTTLEANYILQESVNRENGQDLTYTPKHEGKITASRTFGTGARLEATLRAVSKQFTDLENSETNRLGGYGTVDAKLIVPVTILGLDSELYAQGYNLLDKDFQKHNGYPDEGIRGLVGINISW